MKNKKNILLFVFIWNMIGFDMILKIDMNIFKNKSVYTYNNV